MSQSVPQGIPIRHVKLNHMSELPFDYGTTPGGTLFSTTPGGTRIIYDRSFLLKCRNSPMSNTPPSNLPDIPGVTSPEKSPSKAITKIEEKEIVKENGGNVWEQQHIPDVCPNAKGPLQQYRHRNFVQQNNALIEKTLQQAAWYSMRNSYPSGLPTVSYLNQSAPPSCNHTVNKSSGDGLWHAGQRFPQFPAAKKYPTSQLSAWRQAKFNQALSQTISQTLINTSCFTTTNNLNAGCGYRGRGRDVQPSALPTNLCRPMQKLFMSRNADQCRSSSASRFDSEIEVMDLPVYGQLHEENLTAGSIDENSNTFHFDSSACAVGRTRNPVQCACASLSNSHKDEDQFDMEI